MRTAALVFLVACGSSQSSAPAADPAPDPDPAVVDAPAPAAASGPADRPVAGGDTLWSEMGRKERAAHMKNVVVPEMQKVWAAYDGDKYKRITCLLCHGDGVLDGNYDMPSAELPRLDFGPGWKEFAADHEAILAFMKDEVSPGMADLLGRAKYTEENPSGFGCLNCHMAAEK